MQPHELLDETTTPDGQRLTFSRHAGDHYIEVDGQTLMSTRAPGSERALAEHAAGRLASRPKPRVAIGGLGLGFTLAAALESFPARATVVVIEYFEAVVRWNRQLGTHGLDHPRVTIEVADVVDHIHAARGAYDAILLDVDNGPSAWCFESNGRLYQPRGLASIRKALRPGGVLAIWSSVRSDTFVRKLSRAGFRAEEETVRSRGKRGERYTIFWGVRD